MRSRTQCVHRTQWHLTLAAFAKCPSQPQVGFMHGAWLIARGNKNGPEMGFYAHFKAIK